MQYSFALVLTAIVLAVVSPTGVSSFSISKRTPVQTPTPTLFRERTSCTGGEKLRTYCIRDNSLITLRGGSDSSVEPAAINSIPIRASEAYYLVWSPSFFQKLAIATTLLAVVRRIGWDQRLFGLLAGVGGGLRWVPPGLVPNFVWPLLTSSCCAIQLLFNVVSVAVMGAGAGCLGFNTILGPIRPYLLAVMVAYHTIPTSPSATLIRYAVALMPEAVSGWNALLRTRWRNNRKGTSATTMLADNTDAKLIQATLVVEVPTMGCVACVNKIESSLRNCAPGNVETASSWLNPKDDTATGKKGGRAKIEVRVSSRKELDDLTRSLVAAIEDAGFNGSTIENLDIQTNGAKK
jgi:copper chaperone CopZ